MASQEWVLGVDLGGTLLKMALVNGDGIIERPVKVPSRVDQGYEAVFRTITETAQNLMGTEVLVKGIGLGVAGLVDPVNRKVIASPNCPLLVNKPMGDDLERFWGKKVEMMNDANAMALGEGWVGAARSCSHYVAITLGTGVGGAVVIDGEIVEGFRGMGGEIGHIPISQNGPKCQCGGRGCLESYVGKRGIERLIKRRFPLLIGKGMKELADMAQKGDQDAQRLFRHLARMIGVALTGLVNLLAPQMIVIGGGIALAGQVLLDPLEKEIRTRAYAPFIDNLKITPAQLGIWAGVIGAARVIFRNNP